MSFSASTIANSARRVRQRRRQELEQQQQKQQQQEQHQHLLLKEQNPPSLVSSPSLSPRTNSTDSSVVSGGGGEPKLRNSMRIPTTVVSSDAPVPPPTVAKGAASSSPGGSSGLPRENNNNNNTRSMSPQSMIMSMSSVYGIGTANLSPITKMSSSPPGSPRVVVTTSSHPGNNNTGTTTTPVLPSHFRKTGMTSSRPPATSHNTTTSPKLVSPNNSPTITSRSWDEFDQLQRPPSPSIQRSSSWTLQPKLYPFSQPSPPPQQTSSSSSPQQQSPFLKPRNPRIVAELGSFTTPSTTPAPKFSGQNSLYAFRRVNSSPRTTKSTTTMYGSGGSQFDPDQHSVPLQKSGSSDLHHQRSPGSTKPTVGSCSSMEDDNSSVEGSVNNGGGGSVGSGTGSLVSERIQFFRQNSSKQNQYTNDRPPTTKSNSNMSGTTTMVGGGSEDDGAGDDPIPQPPNRNRGCVSPAHSTASTSSSATVQSTSASTVPTAASLRLLCQAIQHNGPRPPNLSYEEKALWDAIHIVRSQARQEGSQHAKEVLQQQQLPSSLPPSGFVHTTGSSSPPIDSAWESKFVEIQEQAVTQQRDNSRSLQAIQRVLADVQAERDQAVLRLHDYYRQPSPQGSTESCTSSVSIGFSGDEKECMQRELKAMSERIISLEKELCRNVSDPEVKVTVEPFDVGGHSPVSALQPVVDVELNRNEFIQLERDKELLTQELEWKNKEIEQLIQQVAELKVRRDTVDSADTAASVISTSIAGDHPSSQLESYKKELAEKSSALENAKMIIVSLENASGSIASELRRKLRERDEDMAQIQKELAEKQRTLDTLATELRDLQKVKAAGPATASSHNSEAAQVRRLQLSSRLETNLAEIRAAAVILESTQDASAVSNLSNLLTDSASALKEGIDVIENGLPEDANGGPLRLHRELEEKKKSMQRLEEILRKQTSEAARYKTTMEDTQRRKDEEVHALHAEIKILRQQCNTNMEVLTRKERELAVLRDSLRMEDDDVGYISDDEPDDDEQQPSVSSPLSVTAAAATTHHVSSENYGPSQAEALATLLSHGGNHSFDSGAAAVAAQQHITSSNTSTTAVAPSVATTPTTSQSQDEHAKDLEALKSELSKSKADYEKVQRQLKVEKESLSNAKMIISSLERASKSMMEDLRARLQDSNTAIASLLEKSLESERQSMKLRQELEELKRDRYENTHEDIEETTLVIVPPPTPLLLTETID